MARLTTEQLETIRERIEGIWFDEAYVKGDPWKGYEVRCVATGQTIAETSAEIDAEFIANAREDIPKLLAEVEALRSGIKTAIAETSCDDTWDYLNRLLDGKPPLKLPYRIGGDA